MEKETMDNVRGVCPDCIQKGRDKFDHSQVKTNDHVKVGFETGIKNPKEGPTSEHIWILVTEITEDEYTGIVRNEPFWIPELNFGDLVTIAKSEVWDLLKTKK